MSAAPKLTIHNPDLLGRDDLVGGFVARRRLLASIVEDLGRDRPSHRLLLGPRGMGKTTLLRRLYFAVHETPALASRWMPVVFREEQYNVARISDFWLNCLDALGDALDERGRDDESAELDAVVERVREGVEPARAREALAALERWAKRHEKKLLLLVDNFDLVLDRLDADAHWALREVLSGDGALLIGASVEPHRATYEYQRAFYDFFRPERLSGLDERETTEVLLTLSELRATPHVREILVHDPGRVRTLRVLTGGNPRAIVLVHHLLANASERTVVDDLLALLDLSTPLYKARFEQLAPQAQIVVDALALAWDPQTAAAVARRASLDVSLVSAQLSRLANDGVVEKVKYPGARAGYQIAERLFNIWYLVRSSRRMRRRLLWLVEFLRDFYGPAHVRARALALAHDGKDEKDADLLLSFATALEQDERLGLELRAMELLAARIDLTSVFDLDGEDAHLSDAADRMRRLQRIREQVAHLPPLPDGRSVADAITGEILPIAARERMAAEAADSATREGVLTVLASREAAERADEFESLRGCLRRGLLDAPVRLEEARALRAVEPDAYRAAVWLHCRGDAAALEHSFGDVAQYGEPVAWMMWLRAAERANAHSLVGRLLNAKGQDIRLPPDGLRGVLLVSLEHRAGLVFAAYIHGRGDLVGAEALAPVWRLLTVPLDDQPAAVFHRLGSDGESNGVDDYFLRFGVRRAVIEGAAAEALAWLDESGTGERHRPLREAVAAVVHGSDHLLTVAPEVREPAEKIAAWLTFRPEEYLPEAPAIQSREPARAKRTRASPQKRASSRRGKR